MDDGGDSWESLPGYEDRLARAELAALQAEVARLRRALNRSGAEPASWRCDDMSAGGATAPASADAVARGTPTRASSVESTAALRPAARESAGPAGQPGEDRVPATPAGQPRWHNDPAGPAGQPRKDIKPALPRRPCEDELKKKKAENARLREDLKTEQDRRRQLQQRVEELERQLKAAQSRPVFRPYGGGP
jgi:hypothetical protein